MDPFAFGSAFFAGLTAILAKIGIRNMDSDLATALRTGVVLIFCLADGLSHCRCPKFSSIEPKTLLFLVLSGISTGALLDLLLQGAATGRCEQSDANRQRAASC